MKTNVKNVVYITGTREERGIAAWHVGDNEEMTVADRAKYVGGGYEVYSPLIPERILQMSVMKYVPFLPHRKPVEAKRESERYATGNV